MGFNKMMVVGNLGSDPEIKFTQAGKKLARFSVASTEKRKIKDQWEEKTLWFRITVWGAQADSCEKYLHKGSQVLAEGALELQTYEDKDGNTRHSLEIPFASVTFLGGAKEPTESEEEPEEEPKKSAIRKKLDKQSKAEESDEDIPF